MSENIEKFASLMSNRMVATAGAVMPSTVELGTIASNYDLIPDNFRASIPKGDYMVDIRLTSNMLTSKTEHTHGGGIHGGHEGGGTGSHSHSGGEHDHLIPNEYRGLKPGDRVLIAWCGNEAVVIAIVVSS